MTKQPHSGTKLRLSKLFHWLAVLCFIKLSILGALLLDLPLPTWLGGEARNPARQEQMPPVSPPVATNDMASRDAAPAQAGAARDERPAPQAQSRPPLYSDAEHAPQGAEAARLAAAARPRDNRAAPLVDAALPAPLVRAGLPGNAKPDGGDAAGAPPAFTQHMPTPAALPAPQAQPGAQPPAGGLLLASARPNRADESDLLDLFGLRRLPVPGLGSVQAAHAAALDMPVPRTPGTSAPTSAFAPPEQGAPLSVPGAPPIPANIPRGQGGDGAPLPPRSTAAPTPAAPPLPQETGTPGAAAPSGMPVPSVNRGGAATGNDANLKAQELARQQQDILMLRQQMDQRLKDMQNTEKKMQDMIREAKGLENEKVKRLILTYSNMKPKAAAKALENMEERVAIRILSGMTPKQSGEIMTYMEPVKTAKLTELITRMRITD